MKQTFVSLATCLLGVVTFFSCEKSSYEVLTNFKVRLASSSYNADDISIEIKQVKVNYEDTTWVELTTPVQVYNILAYQNNADTLIAQGKIQATSIVKQLKLIIGKNNTIRLNGKTQRLFTINSETELILPVNKKLNRNVEIVNIKFNPTLSITQNNEGGYTLSPVATLK